MGLDKDAESRFLSWRKALSTTRREAQARKPPKLLETSPAPSQRPPKHQGRGGILASNDEPGLRQDLPSSWPKNPLMNSVKSIQEIRGIQKVE